MTDTDNEVTALDTLTAADEPPSTDLLFKTLADGTRRRLLEVLRTESGLSLDELTDILVGAAATDGPVGPAAWRRVRVRLVHNHLPLLADAGLVTYEDGTVERSDSAAPVDDVLAAAEEYEATVERRRD